jgi:hypothetical protein
VNILEQSSNYSILKFPDKAYAEFMEQVTDRDRHAAREKTNNGG